MATLAVALAALTGRERVHVGGRPVVALGEVALVPELTGSEHPPVVSRPVVDW